MKNIQNGILSTCGLTDLIYAFYLHTMKQVLLKILVSPLGGTAVNAFDPQDFPPFTFSSPQEPQMAPTLPLEHSTHFSQAET